MNDKIKVILVLIFCLACSGLEAEDWDSFEYFPPMSVVYHPVSTQNPEAQFFFDQGLLAIYAFNHDQAYILFEQSAKIDPQLAMAYWGMALALGENINSPINYEREKKAYALMQKALSLSKHVSENEKAYIEALAVRYSPDMESDKSLLRMAYKEAMQSLSIKFPDDLDAATLYSESMMDLRPWRLWTSDGKPEEGTLEVVDILESVLKRDPEHLGANHYYIHAIEASQDPQRGLISAYRLNNLLPEWGHILHMPSHIFILVGDYEASVQANKAAVESDLKYIKKHGISGFYPLHYISHNYFFLCRSYLWQERYELAAKTAHELEDILLPNLKEMPQLQYYALAPLQVYLYSHNWEGVLHTSKPDEDFLGAIAFWHFARSMAFLNLGDINAAEQEKHLFLQKKESLSPNENLGYNSAQSVLMVAKDLLDAAFAGKMGFLSTRIEFLEKAVQKQDHLHYNEPPDWFYPIRQTLGAALLEANQPEKAEYIFRQALNKLPRNGRSLFGLAQALKIQAKSDYSIRREALSALKYADRSLNLEDL